MGYNGKLAVRRKKKVKVLIEGVGFYKLHKVVKKDFELANGAAQSKYQAILLFSLKGHSSYNVV